MFNKKTRDSVAIHKQARFAERALQTDRKRALITLLVQSVLLISLLITECMSFSFFELAGVITVITMVIIY